MDTINIVGDTHDVPALEKILSKLDNVFSLGDIVAVNTKEYLANVSRYSKVWKSYISSDFNGIKQEDIDWFYNINVDGWKEQLLMISKYNKTFYVNRGNSDSRVLKCFPEMKNCLESFKKQNDKFHFIEKPTVKIINNILLIFLPYQDDTYDLIDLLSDINKSFSKIIVLGHCPLFKQHYINHYEAVKYISKKLGELIYIHGHVHADNTYQYKLSDLPDVEIITPKAEDCKNGMGYNHEYIELNTLTGHILIKDLKDNSIIDYKNLPEEYLFKNHWNLYVKPNT